MNNKTTGIYIHFPYCEAKCPYCDFNSHVTKDIPHERFLQAYIKDLQHHASLLKEKPSIKTVFFGGGTPSLMNPSTVKIILQNICEIFCIETNTLEVTLEANPSSFEVSKFYSFQKAGINRISIGVQSFIEDDLKTLGRVHSSMQSIDAINSANKIFNRVSFDLIYAREGQQIKQWEDELQFALQTFNPNHISLYSLTIEKGTKFFSMYKNGNLTIPQNQDEFYTITNEICSKYGLKRYEVSNYAKEGFECKHNILYWTGKQYIGIGPGAHGRINTLNGRCATMNFNSPEKYLKSIEKCGNALQTYEILDNEKLAWELISTGLRTKDGFEINSTTEQFINFAKVELLKNEGLITQTATHIIPTSKGISLCDGITKFISKE